MLEKLGEIKGLVQRSDTRSKQQQLSVEAKFDVLTEAAARAGRREWRLMFGGVILGLILQQFSALMTVWKGLSPPRSTGSPERLSPG